ncbi:prolyl oligopeptidase family serine peptidase [Rhizobiales bacterium]|uniref:alpha/beta hydrolase n=1 Tax=Hongsoonwoonella zoysiae TaxID=2821844 RepID=UPI00155FF63C|nr:prolyl oligopeptidase family serine peptidase [Hongsoonwoonella zoysiae]NRG17077.1 prolyl oligopeptidase family serine peptidase [Hongsoonwoonella zoysiae]
MLDGPRLSPLSGEPAKRLVIILHGYGADGADLIELGRAWAEALPETAFVAPNAPDVCDIWAAGRQWFPLTMRDPSEYWRGVVAARPVLDEFIDAELARHALSEAETALVGFSQGAMMALHAGLRRKNRLAGIAAYSGLLAGPEFVAEEAVRRPPILLVHGEEDDVVPPWHRINAQAALEEAGFEVSSHGIEGLGHGIDPAGTQLGAAFLRRVLA